MNNYTIMLKEHNLKATPQRLAIVETIEKLGHVNIDKLYETIKDKFESISLATIYKNINTMTKSMLLFEVKLPNEKPVYEIVKENHSHLLCKKCGVVQDIDVDTKSIIADISHQHTFSIIQSDLVLSGYCQNCQTS